MSSEQAEGVLHKIGLVSNLDRHTLVMARQADLTEAIRYADFHQPVEIEPFGDSSITDDNPDSEFINELLNGNAATNGSEVVELMADITPYKCLGHLYINEDNQEEFSLSSIIILPLNDHTESFALGDIIVANQSSFNLETVREIVVERGTAFVHTELADCSDNSTYVDGFKKILSQAGLDSDEVELSCRGGTGRQNLLVLNDDILEDELDITMKDTIVGGVGDRFIGKVISRLLTAEYVIIEVLTATTISELESLPHHSQISSRRRVRRGSFTFSPTFSFSQSYTRQITSASKCTGKISFIYSPSFTFILDIGWFSGLKAAGMEFTGTKEFTIEFICSTSERVSASVYIPLGQKSFGTFRFVVGVIPIIVGFHGRVGLQLSAEAQVKFSAGYSDTTKCTDKAAMMYRKGPGLSFPNSKTTCTTNASPTFTIGDSNNPDSGLARASATAVLTVGVTAVVPPAGRLPNCKEDEPSIPDVIQSATGSNVRKKCTAQGTPTGLSLTATISAKVDIAGTLCAHNCPILLSVTAGLDNFALKGAVNFLGFTAQTGFKVPLDFIGYRKEECIKGIIPCSLSTDAPTKPMTNAYTGDPVTRTVYPMTTKSLCYCDPPTNEVNDVKKGNEPCQCDFCPDMKTLKRKHLSPKCPCYCRDGSEHEMLSDGTCPCECVCADGSEDMIGERGECPCECDCPKCDVKSKLGPYRCLCDDQCPPCLPDETQVFEKCQCFCKKQYECGIPPTCVRGRKGPTCEQPDCFPCQGCNGNGYCSNTFSQCSSFCQCNRRWVGRCCERLRPRPTGGDPHLETIDGTPYDFFGIGEFAFCHSRLNDFGVHIRFFKYSQASLIGAVAIKAVEDVVTITTPGTSAQDKPTLRVNGDPTSVANGGHIDFGNSTVGLDFQPMQANGSSQSSVAYMSFEFKSGTRFTVEVRYSPIMERQYINVLFAPTVLFRGQTEGLCGFMDDDENNDLYGPDGTKYDDPIEFVESWRLSMNRPEDVSPRKRREAAGTRSSWSWDKTNFHEDDVADITYTDPNFVPSYETPAISHDELQIAVGVCESLGIEDSLLDGCIYDIAVTNDTSFGEQEMLKMGCPSQCSGKGTCIHNTICECLDGWSGEDCSTGDCGVCVRGSCVKGFCSCDVGSEGEMCDKEATCLNKNNCTDSTDPPQGQCQTTDVCLCNDGFTGTDCSLVAVCAGYCSGKGICIDFDVCRCNRGWNGTSCVTPSCESLGYCTGYGACSSFDNCDCNDGWEGLSCSVPDCSTLGNCYGNGECISPNTCQCYNGYVGQACNITLDCAHLSDCNDQGLCVLNDELDELSCRCNLGYTGDNCGSIDCSDFNNCNNKGTCVEPNLCECNQEYKGSDCTLYSCSTLDFCLGHGDCTGLDVCTCYEGWLGDNCQVPSCEHVNDCSDQGECIGYNECECYGRFDGRNCAEEISENFETPSFNQTQYISTVVENSPIATPVIQIEASDTDMGRNGEITYSIAGGSDAFIIDTKTGEIKTRSVFDFESGDQPTEYELVAVAEDRGTPVKSSSTEVTIMIQDVNDNCPVVNDIKNNIEVDSGLPGGSVITRISATDDDSGVNGKLIYDFFQGSEAKSNLFEINKKTGVIITRDLLSAGREYYIAVLISDQGAIPCSTQTQVTVKASDSLQGTSERKLCYIKGWKTPSTKWYHPKYGPCTCVDRVWKCLPPKNEVAEKRIAFAIEEEADLCYIPKKTTPSAEWNHPKYGPCTCEDGGWICFPPKEDNSGTTTY